MYKDFKLGVMIRINNAATWRNNFGERRNYNAD